MISEEELDRLYALIQRVLGDTVIQNQATATITFNHIPEGLTLAVNCKRAACGNLHLWVYNSLAGIDGLPVSLEFNISYVRSPDPAVLETQVMRVVELVEYLDGPNMRTETDYGVGEFQPMDVIVKSILRNCPILTKELEL